MRFGWAVAELRGRLYFGDVDPGRVLAQLKRSDHALPLSEERSSPEQLIEVEGIIKALAERTGLDQLPRRDSTTISSRSAAILALADKVPSKTADPSHMSSWRKFCEALYRWDADIQDALATMMFGESTAYQVGRGLAECSWALDPRESAPAAMRWEQVLGTPRCLVLTHLIERLTPAISDLSAQAVKGSLAMWRRVASDSAWRNVSERLENQDVLIAPLFLRQQVAIWKDLLLEDVDPHVFELPQKPLQKIATILPILQTLAPQLAFGLISAIATGFGAWIVSRQGTGPWGEFVTAAGIFGVTSSGLSSRAKATANNLAQQLRSAVDADEVVSSVTKVPTKPKGATVRTPNRFSTPGAIAAQVSISDVPASQLSSPSAVARQQSVSDRQPASPPGAVTSRPVAPPGAIRLDSWDNIWKWGSGHER
jgi:hypothetical protein